jgi:rsbT antagonist protein RsbS
MLRPSGIPIQDNYGCVVASVHVDLSKDVLDLFRNELLEYCSKVSPNGVVLDVSSQRVMDDKDFEELKKIVDCARMMGHATVLSGFVPGVVAALVLLDADFDGITATKNLDEAFLLLNKAEKKFTEEEGAAKENPEINKEYDEDDFD